MELLLTIFFLGLRHGFDLDHIAAISDISSSSLERRRSLMFATAYIVGHAAVVVLLGGIAVITGRSIPSGIDAVMGRIVGLTLLILGGYVVYSLIRFRRDFRLQSRWMLVVAGMKRSIAWLRRRRAMEIEIEHEHPHAESGHHHPRSAPALRSSGAGVQLVATKIHSHPHKHVVEAPSDPFNEYGFATCIGVGAIHGIGAETPTQLLLLTSAASVAGGLSGMGLVLAFVAGLMLGNTVLAVAATAGVGKSAKVPVAYMMLAGVAALLSLILGFAYLFDLTGL
jgi:ABC-type nickel/cobalt efflux system permease component RcnA